MREMNILIAGVGGQGTLLASRILGYLAELLGFDVKVSEVHGMAQRGGSVVTHVRFGEKIHSSLVEIGQADVVLAFEALEAMRMVTYLTVDGVMIANMQRIAPVPVIMGMACYPDNPLEALQASCPELVALDALAIAKACGNTKAVNLVLLGVMAARMDVEPAIWQQAIERCVPPKTLQINMDAFTRGYQYQV